MAGIFDDLAMLSGGNPHSVSSAPVNTNINSGIIQPGIFQATPSAAAPIAGGLFDNPYTPSAVEAHGNVPMAYIPGDHEYKLDIRSFQFVETPGYDLVPHRSHTATLGHDLLAALTEFSDMGHNFDSAAIAPIAGAIIQPSAIPTHNANQLSGGMQNRRLRFMFPISISSNLSPTSKTQFVFGYCEFMDYGSLNTGQITLPLDMRMYFNHTIVVENSPARNGLASVNLSDNSQYLHGDFNINLTTGKDVPGTMRPTDLMKRLRSIEMGFGEDEILDTRASFNMSAIAKNSRSNNVSSEYLSRSLRALEYGMNSASPTAFDLGQMHKKAAGAVAEGTMTEDPLMRTLDRATGIRSNGYVTWGELCSLSLNNLDAISKLRTFSAITQQANRLHHNGAMHDYGVYQLGNSMNWNSITPGAQVATRLGQQLPGLMLDCGIGQIEFITTNNTLNRSWITSVVQPSLLSFVPGAPKHLLDRFINKLEMEILRAITLNGQFNLELNVFISVDSDARIFVKYADMDQEYYVNPQFCDAILAPTWINNMANLDDMATKISAIFNTVTRN